jgi:hypothetical protein
VTIYDPKPVEVADLSTQVRRTFTVPILPVPYHLCAAQDALTPYSSSCGRRTSASLGRKSPGPDWRNSTAMSRSMSFPVLGRSHRTWSRSIRCVPLLVLHASHSITVRALEMPNSTDPWSGRGPDQRDDQQADRNRRVLPKQGHLLHRRGCPRTLWVRNDKSSLGCTLTRMTDPCSTTLERTLPALTLLASSLNRAWS